MGAEKLFHTSAGYVVGYYYANPDVIQERPGRHVAHVTWVRPNKNGGKGQGIDYFLIDKLSSGDRVIGFFGDRPSREDIESSYSVNYEILGEFASETEMLRDLASADIHLHMKPKLAKTGMEVQPVHGFEPAFEYVDSFDSRISLVKFKHAKIVITGKQDFYPECQNDLNVEFAWWCNSDVTPDLKWAPQLACGYCYAAHKHDFFPNVYDVQVDEMVQRIMEAKVLREALCKPTKYMRLGKNTDSGAPIFREQLANTLEACLKTGISVIMPTKYPKFHPEIADLLKRTDSTLLPSLGNDKLEPGAVRHGFTNDVRLEEAKKYLEAGVRTVPYVLCDITRDYGGPWFTEMFEKATTRFPYVQLLPIRVTSRKIGDLVLGGWDAAKGPRRQNSSGEWIGGYTQVDDNSLLHNMVSTQIEELIAENSLDVRMCGHSEDKVWCGKCFMPDEIGMIGERQKVDVQYDTDKKRKGWKKRNGQLDLDLLIHSKTDTDEQDT